ncbi:hypothetical protein ACN5W3_004590, partial [Vibrio parahaemolyticus]
GICTMRCVWCLRWYAESSVLRCSHLNRALVFNGGIMQKIFYVSFFLFVIPWVGKQHYPEVFGVWYVQWPSVILSMALLGVGFAQMYMPFAHPER